MMAWRVDEQSIYTIIEGTRADSHNGLRPWTRWLLLNNQDLLPGSDQTDDLDNLLGPAKQIYVSGNPRRVCRWE